MTFIIVAAFLVLGIIFIWLNDNARGEIRELLFIVCSIIGLKSLHIKARLIILDDNGFNLYVHSNECDTRKYPLVSQDFIKAFFDRALRKDAYDPHIREYLSYSLQNYAFTERKVLKGWIKKGEPTFLVHFYFTLKNKVAIEHILPETERQLTEIALLHANREIRNKALDQLFDQCGKTLLTLPNKPVPSIEEPSIEKPDPEHLTPVNNHTNPGPYHSSPGGEYQSPVEMAAVPSAKIPPSVLKEPSRKPYLVIIPHHLGRIWKTLQIPHMGTLPELPIAWEWIVNNARDPKFPELQYAEIQHTTDEDAMPDWEFTAKILREMGCYQDTHPHAEQIRMFIDDREGFDTPLSIHEVIGQLAQEPNMTVRTFEALEYGDEILNLAFSAYFPLNPVPEGMEYLTKVCRRQPASN